MMFLLVYTLRDHQTRFQIEELLQQIAAIKSISWITAQDGLNRKVKEDPMIGGSIRSLFKCSEKDLALIEIKGKDALTDVAASLRKYGGEDIQCELVAIPLMTV